VHFQAGEMPFGTSSREEWAEHTARLICIRDPLVRLADALELAVALWDRPLAYANESAESWQALDGLRQKLESAAYHV
jgi:hypothetical protein